jgi:hypothetical protein
MARIGGAFPLPLAQVQEGGSKIPLGSGGVWYFPPGEYVVLTDASCQIERWDPQSQTWQSFIAASSGGFVSVDGYNFRIHNITGVISSNTITNAGSGQTNGIGSVATGVSIAFAASNTTGYPTATGFVIIGGSVAAPTVTQAGSGFLIPPAIIIDPPPPGGIQATAIAVMTAAGSSGIASITIVNAGAGYAVSPNFWIAPQFATYPGGPAGGVAAGAIPAPGLVYPSNALVGNQNTSATGAQLTSAALTGSGTLLGVGIINAGGGYTGAATVTFTGAAGGTAVTSVVAVTSNANSTCSIQPRVQ